MNTVKRKINGIFSIGVMKRSFIIWFAFQLLLWTVFAVTYALNQDAWQQGAVEQLSNPDSMMSTFFYIIGNNLLLFILIVIGNMFIRFGIISPGLIILLIQGITIGIVAGGNAFEFPFASVAEANWQFLKVGLWETTAYSIICAVTVTKSLYIADTFPAKEWSQVRKLKEIPFSGFEKILIVISILLLLMAAIIETILLSA